MIPCGSRNYELINYNDTCNISGVDSKSIINSFKYGDRNYYIFVRNDLVIYGKEYLMYKFGILDTSDLALVWDIDEWKFKNNKVFRETLHQDYKGVLGVLTDLKDNLGLVNGVKY